MIFKHFTPPDGGLSAPQCEGWLFPNGGAKLLLIKEVKVSFGHSQMSGIFTLLVEEMVFFVPGVVSFLGDTEFREHIIECAFDSGSLVCRDTSRNAKQYVFSAKHRDVIQRFLP